MIQSTLGLRTFRGVIETLSSRKLESEMVKSGKGVSSSVWVSETRMYDTTRGVLSLFLKITFKPSKLPFLWDLFL